MGELLAVVFAEPLALELELGPELAGAAEDGAIEVDVGLVCVFGWLAVGLLEQPARASTASATAATAPPVDFRAAPTRRSVLPLVPRMIESPLPS